MAESNGRRNGRMTGMAGMAERQKEWQMAELQITTERRNGGKATYQIYLIYLQYTPTTTPTPTTTTTTPFNLLYYVIEWRIGGMAEWRNGNRMAEWWNGGMVEWRNGGMAEWSDA